MASGAAPSSAEARPQSAEGAVWTTPGLWRRMACWLYEGMLLFAVVFMAGWLFSTLGQMRDAMDSRRHLLQAFLFIVFGVYFTWFWSRGQTLAMKTWGIRVVDRSGRALTQWRAVWRYLLSWVWFLPPLLGLSLLPFKVSGGESALLLVGWVIVWALLARFHPKRQFWHDAWAGTQLVASAPMSR